MSEIIRHVEETIAPKEWFSAEEICEFKSIMGAINDVQGRDEFEYQQEMRRQLDRIESYRRQHEQEDTELFRLAALGLVAGAAKSGGVQQRCLDAICKSSVLNQAETVALRNTVDSANDVLRSGSQAPTSQQIDDFFRAEVEKLETYYRHANVLGTSMHHWYVVTVSFLAGIWQGNEFQSHVLKLFEEKMVR